MKIFIALWPRISTKSPASNILIPLLILLLTAIPAFTQCNGQERWSVKTGSDLDVAKVKTHPVPIAISVMNTWNNSKPFSKTKLHQQQNNRLNPYELQVYHVEGTLTWYKCECNAAKGDQDYHLVIDDGAGGTIIAEIPNPQCVDKGSPF